MSEAEEPVRSLVVRHPAGPIRLEWIDAGEGSRLRRVHLMSLDEAVPPPQPDLPSWLERLRDDLRVGRWPHWARSHCDLDGLSDFTRRVLGCLGESVGDGQVVSYRQLAERSATPSAVRAVARAVAANPFPLIIPCHRVVVADGHLGGFMGDRQDRSGWKRRLLEREGHRIVNGRLPAPAGSRPKRQRSSRPQA